MEVRSWITVFVVVTSLTDALGRQQLLHFEREIQELVDRTLGSREFQVRLRLQRVLGTSSAPASSRYVLGSREFQVRPRFQRVAGTSSAPVSSWYDRGCSKNTLSTTRVLAGHQMWPGQKSYRNTNAPPPIGNPFNFLVVAVCSTHVLESSGWNHSFTRCYKRLCTASRGKEVPA